MPTSATPPRSRSEKLAIELANLVCLGLDRDDLSLFWGDVHGLAETDMRTLVSSRLVTESSPDATTRCEICHAAGATRPILSINLQRTLPTDVLCRADVSLPQTPGATRRFVRATCPVTGKTFDVRWADLVHWRVDARAVATLVRRSLCLGGDVSMIEHDRVYRLGARGGGDEINEEFYLLIGPNDERVRQLLDTIVKASHDTSAIVVFSHFKSRRIRSPDRALVARSLQDVLVEQLSAGPLIAKTPATRDSGETGAIEPPPGTRWRDVRIRIGEDGLLVAIGDQRWWRTWEAAGFADMRGGTSRHQPTALWLLLRRFARGGSVPIPTSRDRAPRDADTELRREVDALKNQVARLRRLLVALIPVDDPETDPIIARTSQASPLKRPAPRSPKHSGAVIGNEYATSFAIVEQRGPVVLMPSGRGWSDVAIRLVDDDSFEISVPRSSADHVATDTPAGRRTEIIGFDELSEDDATGRDAVAAVLRRILRSDRSATKLGDRDAAFLALRRRLGAVLDLDPRGCLKFDREAQAWLPGFKVVTSDAASA